MTKKQVSIPADEEAAAAPQRLGASYGGAIENSVISATRGGAARGGGENGDELLQPREGGQESVVVERRGEFAVVCKWTIVQFGRGKARALWSRYFQVGGFDCRLLVYPRGDTQALPGYLSIYLQVTDPRSASSSKWDCFASYRLSVVNQRDESKSIQRDSWHRFSVKKKSHGWCDFTPSGSIMDPKLGFLVNDSVLITTEILILNETGSFSRDHEPLSSQPAEALSGKFTWKVHNLSLFKEMIKTQKIMSPVFAAGECNLRLSVYQSTVNGVDHLSMCLESKDSEKNSSASERSCWCLFRMSVANQKTGLNHMHRDSYGRFAGDNKCGDNTSLGWNDYMKMEDFLAPESGYFVLDSAIFIASFHVIKESCSFSKGYTGNKSVRKSEHQGRFLWKIDNFTKLKDLLKKRKITGLCIKSRRFQVGGRDCRLIVYPRGQSQPPFHLSMFLEVTDPRSTASDWSCFVSHRLSVVNQRVEERSVVKESQNRYCKAAKDWGWREFITLTNLFDQDSGFLIQDTVTFAAEVLILKETSTMVDFPDSDESTASTVTRGCNRGAFTWKVENFPAFKDIMETRKIFSKFFQAGGCELRIGVYESFDTLCIYLESDQSPGSDPDRNFWVRYRMAVMNQKHPDRTVCKESSICTKTWNNSVLQFMKVSEMVEPDAGFLMRDTIVFYCEILDCCPWFEFSDLEVLISDDEQDGLSTDPDELLESDDSDTNSGDEEDIFRSLLARAGFHTTYEDNPQLLLDPSQLQVTLREKLLMDAGAVAAFLTGLRIYLDDPVKVKRLLLPTKLSLSGASSTSPSLMNLFMGVKVLQQAILDLLLDIMVECCQPTEPKKSDDRPNGKLAPTSETGLSIKLELRETGAAVLNGDDPAQRLFARRLDEAADGFGCPQAVQSCDMASNEVHPPVHEPSNNHANELRLPEQEELLRLIVNSLRAVDGAVPQGCPEPRRRSESAQKMALVLQKSPKYLQHDLLALVPKLVDPSEHHLAADALLQWLQEKNVELSLRLETFGSLVQLDVSGQVFEKILYQALASLPDANDDSLPAIITCIFKAAAKCQKLPQAATAVRGRILVLGDTVSSKALDVLKSTICCFPEAGEALLRDIDGGRDCSARKGTFVFGQAESSKISDVDVLVEMLTVASLRVEAQRVFERAIARNVFDEHSLVIVLERRHSQRLSKCGNSSVQGSESSASSLGEGDDIFPAIFGLAEELFRCKEVRVREFVSTLYAVMFKVYSDGGHRERMLRGLVERATSSGSVHEVQLGLDILTVLVREEEGTARPVLALMRKAVESANLERTSALQQLQAVSDELTKVRNEKQVEISRISKEKASLSQRLSEAEAAQVRLKVDHKAEIDRLSSDKKDIAERLRDVESQLDWSRAEWDESNVRHVSERKALQDRLREAETQLAQLKLRKRDDLKKSTRERNALAERLKFAESTSKKYEEEIHRLAADCAAGEKLCQSKDEQLDRVRGERDLAESERDEYKQQITSYEAYYKSSESERRNYEECIQDLREKLQVEVAKQALLYGYGLEKMSVSELASIAIIHEEGLRKITALQQQQRRANQHQQVFPVMQQIVHGNGRLNGSSWYPPTS